MLFLISRRGYILKTAQLFWQRFNASLRYEITFVLNVSLQKGTLNFLHFHFKSSFQQTLKDYFNMFQIGLCIGTINQYIIQIAKGKVQTT